MAEQFKSITEARRDLPTLSETVQGGGERFVITNQGKPKAVLLGWEEYKGLLAAAELLNRPKDLADLETGLAQTQKLSFEELKENLRRRKAAQAEPEIAVTVERVAQAAPAVSLDEKLDEINGQVKWIMERLGEREGVVFVDEGTRGAARTRRPSLSAALRRARAGEPIKVEVTKISSPGRRRQRTLASAAASAETEMKAER
jgi:prevent-host-death family protein